MTYNKDNTFPVELISEPYREMIIASYDLGRCTARSLREVWKDRDFFGEGFTAGIFFRISELFYDLEQRLR